MSGQPPVPLRQILIIEDDPLVGETLADLVEGLGHRAAVAGTLSQGLQLAHDLSADLVFLDIQLPDGSGLEQIGRLRNLPSCPEIIVITGHGNPEGAEFAVKSGAWDYIQKPAQLADITRKLNQAFSHRRERQEQHLGLGLERSLIVGQSPAILACLEQAARAATLQSGVLISGETGTGKEVFALTIHRNSIRAQHDFVVVDCASLPETLVESLLFGHEKGSFTGAAEKRTGLIEQASGGTLFLDEVGELALGLQKPFLRALQEKRFRPLGGRQELTSDFRLIAATNRDLSAMVNQGRFRQDLFYRLQSFVINLPPLRQRSGDLELLADHFCLKYCQRTQQEPKALSAELLEELAAYGWPGNVRELGNVMEMTAAAAGPAPTLRAHHLPDYFRAQLAKGKVSRVAAAQEALPPPPPALAPAPQPLAEPSRPNHDLPHYHEFRRSVLAVAERQYFQDLMAQAQGDISRACLISGLSRSQLYVKLRECNLTRSKASPTR